MEQPSCSKRPSNLAVKSRSGSPAVTNGKKAFFPSARKRANIKSIADMKSNAFLKRVTRLRREVEPTPLHLYPRAHSNRPQGVDPNASSAPTRALSKSRGSTPALQGCLHVEPAHQKPPKLRRRDKRCTHSPCIFPIAMLWSTPG